MPITWRTRDGWRVESHETCDELLVARNHALSEADKAQRRVILLTGDTLRPDAREAVEKVGVARLNKPFRAAAVWWVVQPA